MYLTVEFKNSNLISFSRAKSENADKKKGKVENV